MAKNEPELRMKCPRCGHEDTFEVDMDLKLASNVTVMQCVNPALDEDGDILCDYRFAKDQSVKLPSSLVLEAAECMNLSRGYSSLGEFVRECVRLRTDVINQQNNALAFGNFLSVLSEDPETWAKLLDLEDE